MVLVSPSTPTATLMQSHNRVLTTVHTILPTYKLRSVNQENQLRMSDETYTASQNGIEENLEYSVGLSMLFSAACCVFLPRAAPHYAASHVPFAAT